MFECSFATSGCLTSVILDGGIREPINIKEVRPKTSVILDGGIREGDLFSP